ncbi:MAG: hypothetical protein FJZ97_11790 [Chloroflexi bacterium]|nr:hypothetical protein [Chloroflexota bacterium]
MTEGKTLWMYVGIVITVLGLIMLLLAQAPLLFYIGAAVSSIGVVVVGVGVRARLKEKNPTLGAIVLIGAIVAAGILAYLAYGA